MALSHGALESGRLNVVAMQERLGQAAEVRSLPFFLGIIYLAPSHESVNHLAGEYSRGTVSTNGIESVWALLKRGIYGTWHQVSIKHLGRYVDKVPFRLNAGNVERHTLDRLASFVDAVDGKRLTYARLIG